MGAKRKDQRGEGREERGGRREENETTERREERHAAWRASKECQWSTQMCVPSRVEEVVLKIK